MNQQTEQALGKVRLASVRLAEKYLYYASILERFKPRADSAVETMGVTVGDGGQIDLLFDPTFVLSLPVVELVGVVQHEVLHVLFQHLWWVPEEFPDPWAKTVAEETTVNEFVSEPLPPGAMMLSEFSLPPWESTRTRYERLKQAFATTGSGRPASAGNASRDEIPCGLGQADGQPGAGTVTSRAGGQGPPSTIVNGRAPLDNHEIWAQVTPATTEDIEELVAELISPLANVLPAALRAAISTADEEGSGVGIGPGCDVSSIGKGKGSLDWQRALRAFVGRAVERHPSFHRPNRRFPHLVGIIPGTSRQCGKPVVLAGVDTSGSMTNDLLTLVNSELSRLAHKFEVIVVECDWAIQRIYKYRPIENVHGRGGTSFVPPLEAKFLHKHRVDVVVYFTDGCGAAPRRAPRVPVLWCLTPGGQPPATWGRVLNMSHTR